MKDEEQAALLNRLKIIVAQVSGIITMVEQDCYCIDVIKQLHESQAALVKVSRIVLENHLHTCLTSIIRADDPAEQERVLSEINDMFSITALSIQKELEREIKISTHQE